MHLQEFHSDINSQFFLHQFKWDWLKNLGINAFNIIAIWAVCFVFVLHLKENAFPPTPRNGLEMTTAGLIYGAFSCGRNWFLTARNRIIIELEVELQFLTAIGGTWSGLILLTFLQIKILGHGEMPALKCYFAVFGISAKLLSWKLTKSSFAFGLVISNQFSTKLVAYKCCL